MHPLARHIYLASRSSRRRELLKQIGVSFEVLLLREGPQRAADFDETPLAGEAPGDYVVRVAGAKAEAGWARLGQRRLMRFPVLSADTTVALDGKILSKPADREEATAFLRELSGKAHQVHSAVAVKFDHRLEIALSTTEVAFRELDEQEIRQYVVSGEPQDKAGAYAIQGRAAVFVRSISGSYSGVMGLPLYETSQLLAKFGHPTL
ncbi:MAG TPA: Maf family protein [Burkholderiales bacterium]|nr:Maf family protein [Burkholderiales bacterium]